MVKKKVNQKLSSSFKSLRKSLNKGIKKIKKANFWGVLASRKNIIIPIAAFLIPTLFFMLVVNFPIGQTILGTFNKNMLSLEEAEQLASAYIGSEILIDQEFDITNTKDVGSVYSFEISLPNQGVFTSYITKNGQFIFPSGYDAEEFKQKVSTEKTALGDSDDSNSEEMPKSSQPTVQLFLMSFCPYGNQAEEIMMPVIDLLGDKVNISPQYIVSKTDAGYSSLHGKQELNQGVRELCVYKYQPEKFWDFLKEVNADCTYENADTCWTGPARSLGIDTSKISQCEKEEFETLLDQEIALTEKYQVSSSPTLLINETAYQGNRTAEDFKQAICSAFDDPPEECSQILGDEAEAAQGGC